MKILCNDQRVELPAESTVLDCLRAAGAEAGALAAMRGGQVLALNEPLRESCALTPITMDDEEGRRIYERSLRMMMLLAARRLFPGEQVRIEYSAGQGVFVRLPGLTLSPELVEVLEKGLVQNTGRLRVAFFHMRRSLNFSKYRITSM